MILLYFEIVTFILVPLTVGYLCYCYGMEYTETTICQYEYWRREDEKKELALLKQQSYEKAMEQIINKYKSEAYEEVYEYPLLDNSRFFNPLPFSLLGQEPSFDTDGIIYKVLAYLFGRYIVFPVNLQKY